MTGGDFEWTSEKPAVAGWYWYRPPDGDPCLVTVKVFEIGGYLNAVWPDGRSVHIDALPGVWAGPLGPPR